MRLITLPLRAVGLAVAVLAAQGIHDPLHAQGRSAEDTRIIDGHRLTMPMLRKVLPALYAAGNERCKHPEQRDPRKLSIAEMTKSLERCAPVSQALQRADVPLREAAIVFASLLRTGEQAAIRGGPGALPPGVLRDNALLMQQNDPELNRLSKTGGQP